MTDIKTYAITPKNLDESIKLLLTSSLAIHDNLYSNKQRVWFTNVTKIFSAYTKIDNPDSFKDMFINFFNKHREILSKPIFYDSPEGDMLVNDSLFKITEVIAGPGIDPTKIKTTKSDSWSPTETFNHGYVIYFDNDNPKTKAVSIPINEIYQSATKLYKDQNGGAKNKSYPGKILLSLYSTFLFSLPEDDSNYDDIKKNVNVLSEFLDQILGEDKSNNGPLSGITNIMAQVMKSTGLSSGDMNASQLESVLGNALSGDTFKGLSSVVTELMSSVNGKENNNIGDVMTNIGDALKSDSIKDMVSKTASQSEELINSIPGLNNIMESFTGVSASATVNVSVGNPAVQD